MKPYFRLLRVNPLLRAAEIAFGQIVLSKGADYTVITMAEAFEILTDPQYVDSVRANVIWAQMEWMGVPVDDDELVHRILLADIPEIKSTNVVGFKVQEGSNPPYGWVTYNGEMGPLVHTLMEGVDLLLEVVETEVLTPSEGQALLSFMVQAQLPLNDEEKDELKRLIFRFDLRLVRSQRGVRLLFYEDGTRVESMLFPNEEHAKQWLQIWACQYGMHPVCHAKLHREAFGEELKLSTGL